MQHKPPHNYQWSKNRTMQNLLTADGKPLCVSMPMPDNKKFIEHADQAKMVLARAIENIPRLLYLATSYADNSDLTDEEDLELRLLAEEIMEAVSGN